MLETQCRFFPGNFYEIPKSPIFLNFRKPRNFGERVTSTKKAPNFQFSMGFSLNFVELIGYTPHPNLYAQLRTPKHVQTTKKLIFEDVGHKILENSGFFPKMGVSVDQKTPFFKESSANLRNGAPFHENSGVGENWGPSSKKFVTSTKNFRQKYFLFSSKKCRQN